MLCIYHQHQYGDELLAGGWLTSHLWEHWLFTGDEQFLREKAYPLMKGAAEFYKGWLIEDGDGGGLYRNLFDAHPVPFKVAGVTAEPYELAGRTLYKASFETEAGKTYRLVI